MGISNVAVVLQDEVGWTDIEMVPIRVIRQLNYFSFLFIVQRVKVPNGGFQ